MGRGAGLEQVLNHKIADSQPSVFSNGYGDWTLNTGRALALPSLTLKNLFMQTISIQTQENLISWEEIPVPYFARNFTEKIYLAILDEKTFVRVYESPNRTVVSNGIVDGVAKNELLRAWTTTGWTSCTETEFLDKYESAIHSMTLHPKLAI